MSGLLDRVRETLAALTWKPPTADYVEHDYDRESRERGWGAKLLGKRLQRWDIDGIAAWDADPPPRIHKCYVHTRAVIDFTLVERCPCGGICYDHRPGEDHCWIERNSSRRTIDTEPASA